MRLRDCSGRRSNSSMKAKASVSMQQSLGEKRGKTYNYLGIVESSHGLGNGAVGVAAARAAGASVASAVKLDEDVGGVGLSEVGSRIHCSDAADVSERTLGFGGPRWAYL